MVFSERLRFIDLNGEGPVESLCETVARGLGATPKSLPPRLFYDEAGSALFEQITDLPEYYPTRTEGAILETYAEAIIDSVPGELTIIEFGSGSSRKTRLLIEAALKRQESLHYIPIDISRTFLRESSEALLAQYPTLSITALAAEYFSAAQALPSATGPRLILFLGSNIGNLPHDEATDFLRRVRESMLPHDRLLVGTDMVKDMAILQAAYDDSQGVTARFNLNLLERINRELGGHFRTAGFRHDAHYDTAQERIEMRLVSLADQNVRVDDLETDYAFADGESILTEWSQKYTAESFADLCGPADLQIVQSWTDPQSWFRVNLLMPIGLEH